MYHQYPSDSRRFEWPVLQTSALLGCPTYMYRAFSNMPNKPCLVLTLTCTKYRSTSPRWHHRGKIVRNVTWWCASVLCCWIPGINDQVFPLQSKGYMYNKLRNLAVVCGEKMKLVGSFRNDRQKLPMVWLYIIHNTMYNPLAGRPGGVSILEPGIGQFREVEPRRVHTRINSLGLFLVDKLTCGKRESMS